MSGINGVMGSMSPSGIATGSTKSASTGMGIDEFYQMLAAQLKYQDADNPMDTSEMMAQMVQTQMIEAITQMSDINMTTYASSMVGKEATMAILDDKGIYTGENITGTITGVSLGAQPILYIDGKPYGLPQLMSVGTVPEKKDDDTTTGGGTDGDKTIK